jgi:heat shock protein HslJ
MKGRSMMKKTVYMVVGIAALVSLAACAPTASQAGGEITGVVWVLDSLNGATPVSGTTITVEFTDNGSVGGSGGCNRYSGQYSVSGGDIQITQPMASTMMACEQAVMEQESAYFQALGTAKRFVVNGDQLTLNDEGGKAIATFKAQSQSLEGTSWQVISYNNGKQAVTSVLVGSELTADFGTASNLTGSAGCNNYNGGFETDGNKITIGPLASTRMMCSEPEGVMDQEFQFMEALQSAATYKIEGDVLELRTADGALAANFQRK